MPRIKLSLTVNDASCVQIVPGAIFNCVVISIGSNLDTILPPSHNLKTPVLSDTVPSSRFLQEKKILALTLRSFLQQSLTVYLLLLILPIQKGMEGKSYHLLPESNPDNLARQAVIQAA